MRNPRSLIALALLTVAATGLSACADHSKKTTTPSPAAAARAADWLTYHGSYYRSGYAPTMPAVKGTMRVDKTLALDGQVQASPIVAAGITVVATENDTVYAYSSTSRLLWTRHLGTPSPARERPCGNIDPLGITGTPVYAAGNIYVAAEFSGSPPTHQLVALSLQTGQIVSRRTLDLPGVDSAAMQERGALAAQNDRIFVPFGGLAGDCGSYKGRVIAYAATGQHNPLVYTVPTAREAGIWTPPGPTLDSFGHVLVAVGNGASGPGDPYDHSDSVLGLNFSLKLSDSFSPSSWASDNAADLDLGSQGPAIVGPNWIFSAGKSGQAYVLRRTHLGGIGGEVSSAMVCKSFGGTAVLGSVVYVPCSDGVRAVSIDSSGRMRVLWHAASSITGAPVVGGGRVWSLDPGAGTLNALNPSTGAVVQQIKVGSTPRFATPALHGRYVLVPTLRGLTVVTTS